MSSDETPPLTRAEARAQREAAERAAAEDTPSGDAVLGDPPAWTPHGTDASGIHTEPGIRYAYTESGPRDEHSAPTRPRRGRFLLGLAAVIAVLALVSAGLAAYSLGQGPRLTAVQVDPHEAIQLSGSRVILTANQPLQPIERQQVVVTPEVPFTIDTAGRSIGVRFTIPLDGDTEYTVKIAGVVGIGGGPAAELSTSFTTPPAEVYLLQRTSGDDTIFRTGLDGQSAHPVFSHPRISAFRDAGDRLVVAVEEESADRLLVVGLDGQLLHELELPGEGYVQDVQVSDRGGLVGYLYSDFELTEFSGRASVLVTQAISGGVPSIVAVSGRELSVVEWQFVPDTAAALFIDFDNTLFVDDRATAGDPSPLGIVIAIQGIERGTYAAIIQLVDGTLARRDLADGSESELAPSEPDFGLPAALAPFPGGMIQHIIARDEDGMPVGQLIVRVDDAGAATAVFEVGETDAILQACASPSGQYLAITVAPNLVSNPYDDLMLAMPERTETHLMNLRTGDPIAVLAGFNVSWCALGPRM